MEFPQFPRGAAWELTAQKYGGIVQEDQAAVTVGTTVSTGAAADPERVLLIFVNLGTGIIFIAPVNSVSSTQGIALSANGGSLIVSAEEDSTLVTSGWFAVAQLAAQTLYRISVRRFSHKTIEGKTKPKGP